MPQKKDKKDAESQINYKARLEKKLCLAQESPEPIFDVSDCNLKSVPSNIFVLCKVFRKEALYLHKNNLVNLSGGGSLGDLKYIKLLDIGSNKFSKLPSNINELESLEVLNVSNNQLVELPETIGSLTNLILLNLSHNKLQFLPVQIGHCINLEVLNLTFNEPLKKLPDSLGRIRSLRQLDIDSTITYPPKEVCSKGTNEITKFLSQNLKEDISSPSTSTKPGKVIPDFDNFQEKIELHEKLKQEKQKERLLFEKELQEKSQKEVNIQQKLKDNKKKLLEDVKNQQESLDAELAKVQEKKNVDRALLIQLCQEEEKKCIEICKILNLKKNVNVQFSTKWEKERKEEEEMLFNRTFQTKASERKEILASMEELMREEFLKAQRNNSYKRILAAQSLAAEVSAQNAQENFIKKRDKNNAELLDRLRQNEELQKSAVASLLEKSDAASWELSQQVAIVEAQLAELTRLELSRRRLESECQITELNNSRIALTQMLLELFEKQAERRKALVDTMRRMEMMRESIKDSTNFWMEQYEKLLKSKSHEMVKFLEGVDPKLVNELFLNGVFHYLPLLKDVVSSVDSLEKLNSDRLAKLGVTVSEDRSKILSAVGTYLKCHRCNETAPSAPPLDLPSAPLLDSLDKLPTPSSASYLVPDECVICLEKKPEVVFVPCGHICCCYKCFCSIACCPLCRKPIEAAHKKV